MSNTTNTPIDETVDDRNNIQSGDSVQVNADLAELLGDLILVIRYKDGHEVTQPIKSEEEGALLAAEAFKRPDVAVVFSASRQEGAVK